MKRSIRYFFPILMIALFSLFFTGFGPHKYSSRSFHAFWNLGHILFFSLLPFVLFYFYKLPNKFCVHSVLAIAMAAILGAGIELLQSKYQYRQPDLGDLYRDIIGALLSIAFFLPSRKTISKLILRIVQVCTLALVAFQLLPLFTSLYDEHVAKKQFPLLSSFESRFEMGRWHAPYGGTFLDKDNVMTGKASMRMFFDTRKYSMVELIHFPRNWEDFSFFEFSIYNPSDKAIRIVCCIHDDDPEVTGNRYKDRYKKGYQVSKGWHTFRIDLESIRHNPKGRLVDMQRIMGVLFFTIQLPHPRVVNFDDIKLLKELPKPS